MMTNDDTRLMDGRVVASQQSKDRTADNGQATAQSGNKGAWKKVTLGAASGILVGAGAMYASQAFAADGKDAADEAGPAQPEDVKVAKVGDDLSFQDAFDAARAQVGPGGVFRWNGGLYSTYKEDEWNAMSDDEKADFAQAVRPEVRADEIVAERMSEAQPQVVIIKEQVAAAEPRQASAQPESDVQVDHNAAGNHVAAAQTQVDDNDGDVHVVGQGYVQGHQAVAVDLTGNGEADVAVIDMNDNGQFDDPDVVVDREGNAATLGQIAQAQAGQGQDDGNGYVSDDTDPNTDPNLQPTTYENPDLSPDMPDYMDDANVDGTLV